MKNWICFRRGCGLRARFAKGRLQGVDIEARQGGGGARAQVAEVA